MAEDNVRINGKSAKSGVLQVITLNDLLLIIYVNKYPKLH